MAAAGRDAPLGVSVATRGMILRMSLYRAGRLRPAVAILLGMAALAASPGPAVAGDPFADLPTGQLTVTVEVRGQGRHENPNGVEWHALNVSRRLELTLPMILVATASVGLETSPKTAAIRAEQEAKLQPSPALMDMQREMESCEGDQQCLMQASMKFALMMQEGTLEMPQAPDMSESERFEHWMVDRRGTCATGVVAIADKGHGVSISPPEPAAPFEYRRSGERRLPDDLAPVADRVCAALLAVDTKDGTLDLAVPGFTVPVQLTYSGNAFLGETGRSEILVEDSGQGAQPGAVDLFDFPVDPDAREMSGAREIEKVGSVTHAGGYGTTPVGAKITWKFVRD